MNVPFGKITNDREVKEWNVEEEKDAEALTESEEEDFCRNLSR